MFEAMLYRRNEDSTGDAVIGDKLVIKFDCDILVVDESQEFILKIIDNAARDVEALFHHPV